MTNASGIRWNNTATHDPYDERNPSVVAVKLTTNYTYGPGAIRQTKVVDGVTTFYTSIAEIRNFGTANETIILQPRADFRITNAGGANEATTLTDCPIFQGHFRPPRQRPPDH